MKLMFKRTVWNIGTKKDTILLDLLLVRTARISMRMLDNKTFFVKESYFRSPFVPWYVSVDQLELAVSGRKDNKYWI